jgi:DNA-binding HxlR family transcriptional regulator
MAQGTACLVDAVLKLIGDRWTLCLIHELSKGPQRTLELHSAFRGLSTKTLSDRLKNLRKNGLVSRISYPESPPRVEYSLTEKGSELLPLFHVIARTGIRWGIEWKKNGALPRCDICDAAFRTGDATDAPLPPRHAAIAGTDQTPEPSRPVKARKRIDVTLL